MSLAVVHSRALDGLRAPEVTVEVHLANGLPSFTHLVCQLQSEQVQVVSPIPCYS